MLSEIKDISDFKKLDKNMVYEMDKVLTHDIPMLLKKATSTSRKSPSTNLNGPYPTVEDVYYSQQQQPQHQHYTQQQRYPTYPQYPQYPPPPPTESTANSYRNQPQYGSSSDPPPHNY